MSGLTGDISHKKHMWVCFLCVFVCFLPAGNSQNTQNTVGSAVSSKMCCGRLGKWARLVS